MGVLPLQFLPGENAASLGLTGEENVRHARAWRTSRRGSGSTSGRRRPMATSSSSTTIARIDSPVEAEYFRNGGILQTVLRRPDATRRVRRHRVEDTADHRRKRRQTS